MERAFERLEDLNAVKFKQAQAEARSEAASGPRVPTKVPTARMRPTRISSQLIETTITGP
jgi:hypothetical protein